MSTWGAALSAGSWANGAWGPYVSAGGTTRCWGAALSAGSWANGAWGPYVSTVGGTTPCWGDGVWALNAWKVGAWRSLTAAQPPDRDRFNGGGGGSHFYGIEEDCDSPDIRRILKKIALKKKSVEALSQKMATPITQQDKLWTLTAKITQAQNELQAMMEQYNEAVLAYRCRREIMEDDEDVIALLM